MRVLVSMKNDTIQSSDDRKGVHKDRRAAGRATDVAADVIERRARTQVRLSPEARLLADVLREPDEPVAVFLTRLIRREAANQARLDAARRTFQTERAAG